MAKQTSKEQLLKDIRTEHRRLEKQLSGLSADEMIQPGVAGNWSVKDILAHLAAWEQLFIEWYSGSLSVTTPVGMSRSAIDSLNEQIFKKHQSRSLDDILAEYYASYRQIFALIEEIPEGDIFTPGRFSWTGRLTLADYIAGNTCNHYAWANNQIRRWAKRARLKPQLKVKKD